MRTSPHMFALISTCLAAIVVAADGPAPTESGKTGPAEADLVAPDGVPYDNESSQRLMKMKALTGNLIRNGSFESGRYWPYGWQATDGLTTFWTTGGTDGKRCLRIFTDVLDAQWKQRDEQVRAALRAAALRAGGDPQSLPRNPVPPPPERIPTSPPYYDTVAGLHGVRYRSDFVPCKPGAIYRFSIDARAEAKGAPKVFIKGFFDQKVETRDGVRVVRRNAYRAPMTLDPCDGRWRRYARLFHPSRSKSTLGGKPLKSEYLQVQIYAYWKPGSYYFDNVRLEIVGYEKPPKKAETQAQDAPPREAAPPASLDDEEFPVLNP